MSEAVSAYPLSWPPGWRRTNKWERTKAKFSKKRTVYREGAAQFSSMAGLSVHEAVSRIDKELSPMGVSDNDVIISTNLQLRLDGWPRSGQNKPEDPGAAVYWKTKRGERRCMAVDRYDRIEDNLAAIAATLSALRSIERHGGAEILDRAFTGFKALPAPEQWWQVLGLMNDRPTREEIEKAHRRLAKEHHPDRGGEHARMARINTARETGLRGFQ